MSNYITLTEVNKAVLISRLQKQTIYKDNCWLFIGSKAPRGYRCIQIENRRYLVHRLSAAIFLNLDLNSALQANHKLECVNKNCWNPDHLYVGTQADNMNDLRKLISKEIRFCKRGHIIASVGAKNKRYCRECRNIRVRNSKKN